MAALKIPRLQIGVTYNDNRGRPTRSNQKLDNQVKTILEDQDALQEQFNLDVAQAAADASDAAADALAASTAASAAAASATSAASNATTAATNATNAATSASSAAASATATASSAATAASNATAAASSASTAASNATTAASNATASATSASAAASSASAAAASAATAAAFSATYGVAIAGRTGLAFGISPSGGYYSIAHGYTDPSGGSYPAAIQHCSAIAYGAQGFFVSLISVDSSNLTFHLADHTGASITGGSYSVVWRVAGA